MMRTFSQMILSCRRFVPSQGPCPCRPKETADNITPAAEQRARAEDWDMTSSYSEHVCTHASWVLRPRQYLLRAVKEQHALHICHTVHLLVPSAKVVLVPREAINEELLGWAGIHCLKRKHLSSHCSRATAHAARQECRTTKDMPHDKDTLNGVEVALN